MTSPLVYTMGVMAQTSPPSAEPRSPVVANLVVILGFVAIFSTFATESPASWAIGVVLVLAGGVWAGVDRRTSNADPSPGGPSHGGAA